MKHRPSKADSQATLTGTVSALSRVVAAISYPTVLAGAFALFALLVASGLHVTPASYVAGLAAAGLVTLHELQWPYRAQWRPGVGDVRADLLFMLTVQVALPYLLSITVVIFLAEQLQAGTLTVEGLWPHQTPVAVQVCLMLLAADFLRYWLHRAFHKFPFMWRYHAVHHSPHRLYWLNVGRFHPIEKAVQFAVDTLPFALLGVSTEVLAAYFVFYAVNGFFQHSNCNVRLGPLNYLVSGPELHRWHHSEFSRESDTNFGNNLIIWDLLFGTRFLPVDREVGRLGLVNRNYPTGFLPQMKTPFVRGLDKR